MAYDIRPTALFERSFSKIQRDDQKRITRKLDHLATNPEIIGAPMKNLPPDLRSLHKVRVGDWRIFFWVDHNKREITLYDVDWRDQSYKRLLG